MYLSTYDIAEKNCLSLENFELFCRLAWVRRKYGIIEDYYHKLEISDKKVDSLIKDFNKEKKINPASFKIRWY